MLSCYWPIILFVHVHALKALPDVITILPVTQPLLPLFTGNAGSDVAWYINDTLAPELVVRRRRTYRFVVEGGNNSADQSNYNPFYITNSPHGGILNKTASERSVRVLSMEFVMYNIIVIFL